MGPAPLCALLGVLPAANSGVYLLISWLYVHRVSGRPRPAGPESWAACKQSAEGPGVPTRRCSLQAAPAPPSHPQEVLLWSTMSILIALSLLGLAVAGNWLVNFGAFGRPGPGREGGRPPSRRGGRRRRKARPLFDCRLLGPLIARLPSPPPPSPLQMG